MSHYFLLAVSVKIFFFILLFKLFFWLNVSRHFFKNKLFGYEKNYICGVTFSTPGNQGATFSIDQELGHLILEQPLLHQNTREYLLLVRAMDHAHKPKSASIPVRITVRSSLNIPPSWTGAKLPRVVELSEWALPSTVVAMVTAASPPSLHYEIVSGNSAEESFVVSPSSGVLSLNTPLDYETNNFYNLTIKATNTVCIAL